MSITARTVGTIAIMLLVTGSAAAAGENLVGRASVIDGDTIEIHGTRIRLHGIDAPESAQLCRNQDSDLYRCGAAAANGLDAFIADRPVSCQVVDRDRYGRSVADCEVAGEGLGEWMVDHGHALDWPRYSRGRYAGAQDAARRAERGLWGGSFVEPWLYRSCIRAGGRPAACSDEGEPTRAR